MIEWLIGWGLKCLQPLAILNMLNCDICKKKWLFKVRIKNGKQICSECNGSISISIAPAIQEKVWIGGTAGWQLKSRVEELKRRVILPYERNDGKSDYYLGRRLNSGKIQEREPVY